jgi:hypothetical protein
MSPPRIALLPSIHARLPLPLPSQVHSITAAEREGILSDHAAAVCAALSDREGAMTLTALETRKSRQARSISATAKVR